MSTGLWVAIWVLLVIGALAAFVLIALHLFRKAKRTLAQAQDVMEVLGEFGEAMDAAEAPEYRFTPGLGADPDQRAEWRHRRRVNRVHRARRKQARRQKTLARWQNVPTEVTRR